MHDVYSYFRRITAFPAPPVPPASVSPPPHPAYASPLTPSPLPTFDLSPIPSPLSQLSMVATPLKSKRPAKLKVIEEVTELLGKTTFIFSVPSSNIKANDVVKLRKELPEGCTARVVKNKLMRIACKGTDFEELAEVTTGENFWMFVEGEDNLAEPIKIIAAFAKNADKDNVRCDVK